MNIDWLIIYNFNIRVFSFFSSIRNKARNPFSDIFKDFRLKVDENRTNSDAEKVNVAEKFPGGEKGNYCSSDSFSFQRNMNRCKSFSGVIRSMSGDQQDGTSDAITKTSDAIRKASDSVHRSSDPITRSSDQTTKARDSISRTRDPIKKASDSINITSGKPAGASDPITRAKDTVTRTSGPIKRTSDSAVKPVPEAEPRTMTEHEASKRNEETNQDDASSSGRNFVN